MSSVLALADAVPLRPVAPPSPAVLTDQALDAAITAACGRIAPLWPLRNFVAVNPFLGFSGQSFSATAATLRRVAGVDMLMPRSFYREALAAGFIADEDLALALLRAPRTPAAPTDAAALRAAAAAEPSARPRPRAVVATVAEVLDRLARGDRHASRTAFMIDEISKWCAAYFDEGQAAWRLPGRSLPPYRAWRHAMRHDRNAEAFGIKGFRKAVGSMPDDARAAVRAVVDELGIPLRAVEDYCFRALFDIGGWSAYARHLDWQARLAGRQDHRIVDLLAIRLVWGYALFRERSDEAFKAAWARAMADAAALPRDDRLGDDPDLVVDLALQAAYEAAYQRRLVARLTAGLAAPATPAAAPRPAVQAVFCIDVRSEVYRRALETVAPEVQTLGFAGFFGFAVDYVPLGRRRGRAQCPVLLAPAVTVCEAVAGAGPAEEAAVVARQRLGRRAAALWTAFRASAVSSFAYVETAGLAAAAKIAAAIAAPLASAAPAAAGPVRLEPRLDPMKSGGRATGMDAAQRLATARGVLKAMSLTDGFGRLVLLVGHGSTTVNNPHGSGLDCGACGGNTGEANARIAAAVLNDAAVRTGLADDGIVIPDDTWFVAALHDTTTDEVRIFDADRIPGAVAADLGRLRERLAAASGLARAERATRLGITDPGHADAAVPARSRDWSEVRPEWGLAGNAAFIAAPRGRTAALDLEGRAFLHSYDWRADEDASILELIMTAPMVVASWINLQYYGSTVNNRVFGAGNKVLHNVVGTIGVLEGNGGDLRTGLPWQSVHDGTRFVHEPVRLNVVIEAPVAAINGVIRRRAEVRDLVENGWVHLFAIDEAGILLGYAGNGTWITRSAP